MKHALLAIAIALSTAPAQADTFSFEGEGARLYNWWTCHCDRPAGGESFAWLGQLEVDLQGVAEGSFSEVAWSLTSNVYSASGRAGYGTTVGGQLTFFSFYDGFDRQFSVSGPEGIRLDYYARFADRLRATATLHPVNAARVLTVSPVPEPSIVLLMLAGVGLACARRRVAL